MSSTTLVLQDTALTIHTATPDINANATPVQVLLETVADASKTILPVLTDTLKADRQVVREAIS